MKWAANFDKVSSKWGKNFGTFAKSQLKDVCHFFTPNISLSNLYYMIVKKLTIWTALCSCSLAWPSLFISWSPFNKRRILIVQVPVVTLHVIGFKWWSAKKAPWWCQNISSKIFKGVWFFSLLIWFISAIRVWYVSVTIIPKVEIIGGKYLVRSLIPSTLVEDLIEIFDASYTVLLKTLQMDNWFKRSYLWQGFLGFEIEARALKDS